MKPKTETFNADVAVIGIDIGKDVFHLIGFCSGGRIAFRRKIKRLALAETFKKLPPCVVGLEACLSAHFVSRTLRSFGHDPRIIPAIYVKPFVKGQKNDYNDAEAIAEATLRPNLRVVREKTGLSWGGILAQEFYRLYAERFRSLVLADTYAGWRGSLPETVWKERLATCLQDATGPRESLIAKFLPGVFTDAAPQHLRQEFSAIISEFHPVGFRLMSLSSAEVDTRDLLPRVDVATLLLWGEDDRRSPPHVAEQFHAAIPGAELAIIPRAGHLSNMEQPDVFNAHVRRFCLSAETRA